MLQAAVLVAIPAALLIAAVRRQSARDHLQDALFAAAAGGDIRVLQRVLAQPGARALADTALDGQGRTAYDVACELRLGAAATLLGRGPASLAARRARGGGDVRAWQTERVLSADRRALAARARPGVRLPALSVLVEVGGKPVFERVEGYADMRAGTKAGPDTRFMVASVTKQFVAAAVLRLQDRGALDVRRDALARWFPGFPRAGEVTLAHLLAHTSGLRDHALWEDRVLSEAEMVALIAKAGYAFAPGERMMYSNAGYVLLGLVVQRASGKPLARFLHDEFFGPLGMSRTGIHTGDPAEFAELHTVDGLVGYMAALVPAGRALLRGTPYTPMPLKMALSAAPGCGGDGGMFSTARDLARWNQALFEEMKVVSKRSLDQMLTRAVLNDGTTMAQRGFGLALHNPEENFGVVCYEHGGFLPGYTAKLKYFPDRKMTIVVLSNASSGKRSAHSVANALHSIWSHEMRSTDERDIPAADESVGKEELKKFVGNFDFTASGDPDILEITMDSESGLLSMRGWGDSPLVPVSPTRVVATKFRPVLKLTLVEALTEESEFEIIAERSSPGRKVLYGRRQQPEDRCAYYEKRSAMKGDGDLLSRCCGRYDYGLPPVVLRRNRLYGNRLLVKVHRFGSVSLTHMGGNRFCASGEDPLTVVEFVFSAEDERNQTGSPTHLVLHSPAEFPLEVKRLGDA